MNQTWQFGGITLYQGNCMDVLPTLPAESVQACITSPPYWGLRDYGTARWEGGDPGCDHSPGNESRVGRTTLEGGTATAGHKQEPFRDVCRKCGAIRIDQQLGLERVPDCLGWATKQPCGECYVCHTVAWAREVRRVLRGDGVMFLVLGDSYAGSWGNYHPNSPPGKHGQRLKQTARWNRPAYESQEFLPPTATVDGLKPKDLCGIPWRVALALQADGWWLRSDVIWAKPNPMPESVTDRPTKAHEYVFILAKSQRYYWDAEAVKEPAQIWTGQAGRWERSGPVSQHVLPGQSAAQHRPSRNGHNAFRGQGSNREGENGPALREGRDMSEIGTDPNRNIRTVWTVATRPFSGAHFAVFPETLIEPMVKAATSERGCCPKCGKAWKRKVRRKPNPKGINGGERREVVRNGALGKRDRDYDAEAEGFTTITLRWEPDCSCMRDEMLDLSALGTPEWKQEINRQLEPFQPIPCTILDPFGGSGTVASVALRLGRRAILCELNPDYIELQKERIEQTQPMLEGL